MNVTLLVGALLVMGAAPRHAAKPTVAVVPPQVGSGVDAAAVRTLSQGVATELKRSRTFSVVVGTKDVDMLLGPDHARSLASCADASCVAGLGKQLQVDYMVWPQVKQEGTQLALTVNLIEVQSGTVVGTVEPGVCTPANKLKAGVKPAVALALTAAKLGKNKPVRLPRAIKRCGTEDSLDMTAEAMDLSLDEDGASPTLPAAAVLEVTAAQPEQSKPAALLTEQLVGEMRKSNVFARVLSPTEVQASVASQPTLAPCREGPCVKELARVLDVEFLVVGTLRHAGAESTVAIQMIYAPSGNSASSLARCGVNPNNAKSVAEAGVAALLTQARLGKERVVAFPPDTRACPETIVPPAQAPVNPAPVAPPGVQAPPAPKLTAAVLLARKDDSIPVITATSLAESLVDEVTRSGAFSRVLGPVEIESLVDPEQHALLASCADDACQAELAGLLGVDLLVSATVGKQAATHVLETRLIDGRNSRTVARLSPGVCSDSEENLGKGVKPSVLRLLADAKVEGVKGMDFPPEANLCGAHEEGGGRGRRVALLTVGGLGLVTGLVTALAAMTSTVGGLGWLAGQYNATFVGMVPSLGLARDARVFTLRAPVALMLTAAGVAMVLSALGVVGGGGALGAGALAG